jgi:hypothetical protein
VYSLYAAITAVNTLPQHHERMVYSPTHRRPCRYSANFAFHDGAEPPNSGYHMNLQQARFPLSDAFAAKLSAEYRMQDEGVEGAAV